MTGTALPRLDTRDESSSDRGPDVLPAVELLVHCTRPPKEPTEDGPGPPRLQPPSELDWGRFLALTTDHGVAPLVHRRLRQSADSSLGGIEVPESVEEKLRNRVRSNAIRTLRDTDELRQILIGFEEEGLRALPFKGPVLAAFTYGDVSLREYGDLDVVVHREDVTRAIDLLEERGYSWEGSLPRKGDVALLGGRFTMPIVNEYQLQREETTVEIRWHVGDMDRPFPLDFEALWSRRDTIHLSGTELPTLDPIDRLLVLAFHGTKHRWHLLKWIADFAWTVVRTPAPWDELLQRAQTHRLERKFLLGAGLANALWDIDLPVSVDRRLRADGRSRRLIEEIVSDLARGRTTRPGGFERIRYNAKASDSPVETFGSLIRSGPLHPSLPEYRLLPLSGPFHPIYYLVRPLRLLGGAALRILER
ncbi:putative nucleotidyltransferase [Halalkaliarchaeum sp. AArc-CO]|nr:putative nucleotidyltransferase [Halalkaliarchaeum sp. AArc-CO]